MITYIPDSQLVHGINGKIAVQVVLGGFAVVYALFLIHHYFKLIQEECRAPSQVECLEMQSVCMRHFCEQFSHHIPPSEVLPSNGLHIGEERETEIIDLVIDDIPDDSEGFEDTEDPE